MTGTQDACLFLSPSSCMVSHFGSLLKGKAVCMHRNKNTVQTLFSLLPVICSSLGFQVPYGTCWRNLQITTLCSNPGTPNTPKEGIAQFVHALCCCCAHRSKWYLVRWYFEHLQRLAKTFLQSRVLLFLKVIKKIFPTRQFCLNALKTQDCLQFLKALEDGDYFLQCQFLAIVPGSRSHSVLPPTVISTKMPEKPSYTGRTGICMEF